MYGMTIGTPLQFGRSIAVRSEQDLAYLVKESEVVTGQPGREFQLQEEGQQRRYRVNFDGFSYSVTDLSPGSLPVSVPMLPEALETSQLGVAMKEFRLFCDPLQERKPCCWKTAASTPVQ